MPKYQGAFMDEVNNDDDEDEEIQHELVMNQEALSPEEATFKKRYGDLRTHQQKREAELKQEIAELKRNNIALASQQVTLPTNEADLEAWMRKYPDVANVVKTIAMKEVQSAREEVEGLRTQLEEDKLLEAKRKAQTKLAEAHPDFFDDIRHRQDFQDWLATKSQRVYDALYENETDWQAAADVVTLYKFETGAATKKAAKPNNRDAARDVRVPRGAPAPTVGDGRYQFTESQINNMTAAVYEANEEAIDAAMRTGKVFMDLSGGAR
jgi:hypothetical protein